MATPAPAYPSPIVWCEGCGEHPALVVCPHCEAAACAYCAPDEECPACGRPWLPRLVESP